jgi:CubicO group peptidase (beta-lactamase class C family)
MAPEVDPFAQLARWPVKTVAVGVSEPGGVIALSEPRDAKAGSGSETRLFRWASVTKLLTALACLIAVEEGTLELDRAAGPDGSTVRHLLAHASGLPLESGLPGRGTTAFPAPGTRRIYSNAGFELLADVLAEASGLAFEEYLAIGVLAPLGMSDTALCGSPASGAIGSVTDLLFLGRELLSPHLVSPEMLALATTVAFPGLAGVLPGFGRQDPNDWGLGFELRDHKSPHWTGLDNSPRTFGHFGRSGSFLWVDPEIGLTLACLTDTDFGPWAAQAWPALSDAVISRWGRRAS